MICAETCELKRRHRHRISSRIDQRPSESVVKQKTTVMYRSLVVLVITFAFTSVNALVPTTRRAFVSAGAVVASGAAAPAFAGTPVTGAKAPDFDLPNSRGEGTTSLKTLTSNGKWTVLYFYPGAFTSGCTLEARGFQRDIDLYRKLGAQIVGVSVDAPEKNAQFCTAEGLDFYMLSDKNGHVSKEYGSAISIPGKWRVFFNTLYIIFESKH
jgi:peroxiredoxin Q/BCP